MTKRIRTDQDIIFARKKVLPSMEHCSELQKW